MKDLDNYLFDAGGPFLLIVMLGIPALLCIIVVAAVIVTITLIIKAKKKKSAE